MVILDNSIFPTVIYLMSYTLIYDCTFLSNPKPSKTHLMTLICCCSSCFIKKHIPSSIADEFRLCSVELQKHMLPNQKREHNQWVKNTRATCCLYSYMCYVFENGTLQLHRKTSTAVTRTHVHLPSKKEPTNSK